MPEFLPGPIEPRPAYTAGPVQQAGMPAAGPTAVAVPGPRGLQGLPGDPGPHGTSVVSASIVDHRLHLTLSDGTVLDAGPLPDLAAALQAATDAGAAASAAEAARLEAIAAAGRLQIGGSLPAPPSGESAMWLDTTGGNITLNLVTGD